MVVVPMMVVIMGYDSWSYMEVIVIVVPSASSVMWSVMSAMVAMPVASSPIF